MPNITILEKDLSIFNVLSDNDNIVYIPGFAITGTTEAPTLISSYKEFLEKYGENPPETYYASSVSNATDRMCTGWEFATQILAKGFRVLFQRLAPVIDSTKLLKAQTSIIDDSDETKTYKFGFREIYGGTFGNNLIISFVLNNAKSKLFLRVTNSKSGKILENLEICNVTVDSGTIKLKDGTTDIFSEPFANGIVSAVDSSNYIEFIIGTDYITNIADIKQYVAKEGNYIVSTFINPTGVTSNTRCSFTLGKTTTGFTTVEGRDYTWNDAIVEISTEGSTAFGDNIKAKLNIISDTLLYDVKFVTLGEISIDGSTIETADGENLYNVVTGFCATRGDCVAILNPGYGENASNVSNNFNSLSGTATSYASVFAPWCLYGLYNSNVRWCPPALVFLSALADSVARNNPVYLPPAGINRALISGIVKTEYPVGSTILNDWQNKDKPNNINPIMYLNNYGYAIFGQRTLYDVSEQVVGIRSALQELGVRLTVIELKKKIKEVATKLLFEYNNIHTWNEFKSGMYPLFQTMLNDGAIQEYEIIMDSSTVSPDDIDNNTIYGRIRVIPGRAVEDFVISFELYRSGVNFANEE